MIVSNPSWCISLITGNHLYLTPLRVFPQTLNYPQTTLFSCHIQHCSPCPPPLGTLSFHHLLLSETLKASVVVLPEEQHPLPFLCCKAESLFFFLFPKNDPAAFPAKFPSPVAAQCGLKASGGSQSSLPWSHLFMVIAPAFKNKCGVDARGNNSGREVYCGEISLIARVKAK